MDRKPHIADVRPRAAIAGGEVSIRGSGLSSNGTKARVSFGGVEGSVVVGSDSFVVARVPEGAASGELVVTTSAAASEAQSFEVGVTIAENLHPVANPALDKDGNIYATFSGSRGQQVPVSLYQIDLNYNLKPFSESLMNPTGLAFDRNGLLYVSSRFNGTVYRISSTGAASTYVEGMGVATGLAFDEDDNLDRKSTRLNSSHIQKSRMPSSA